MNIPTTVRELLTESFYRWQSSKLGNDLFISDPDRASRIYDAAEHGCDGSTHAEHIEDFREYAEELYREASRAIQDLEDEAFSAAEQELDAACEKLCADIDSLEQWHKANGSLHEEIG